MPNKHKAPKISISGAKRALPQPSREDVRKKVMSEDVHERKSARRGALFLLVILGINFAYIFLSGQFATFISSLGNANYAWVIAGLIIMCGYIGFGSLAFMLAAYTDPTCPIGVRDCISVEACGVTFGNLTPMSAGIMPAQVMRLTQTGLDVGEAIAMQLTRFVVFQSGEVLIAAIMLLSTFEYFKEHIGNIVFLNVVVFIIQFGQVALLLMMCLFPHFIARMGLKALAFAHKRSWINDEKYERFSDTLKTQVAQFGKAFHASIRHKKEMFLTLIVTFFQILCYYSVPWFVLHAMGGDAPYFVCLAGGAMIQMIGNSVPLPGGSGGVEAGFAIYFGPIFGPSAAAGFIVWRLVTFYIPTILCLPLTALRSRQHRTLHQRWGWLLGGASRPQHPEVKVRSYGKAQRGRAGATFVFKRDTPAEVFRAAPAQKHVPADATKDGIAYNVAQSSSLDQKSQESEPSAPSAVQHADGHDARASHAESPHDAPDAHN